MFTGLVEGVGRIKGIRRKQEEMQLMILPPFPATSCRAGDSISVDGVCLTVTHLAGDLLAVDVSAETLSRSTLGLLKQDEAVNLERALKVSDRLGGHLVAGHVDGIGKILQKERRHQSWFFRIGIDRSLSRYTIEKGSIAVDGISLTINHCGDRFFEVNIIPHTASETTLQRKKVGDLVNIETDMLAKYVEKFVKIQDQKENKTTIDMDTLRKHGFGD
jgi:riboflavin synthase